MQPASPIARIQALMTQTLKIKLHIGQDRNPLACKKLDKVHETFPTNPTRSTNAHKKKTHSNKIQVAPSKILLNL